MESLGHLKVAPAQTQPGWVTSAEWVLSQTQPLLGKVKAELMVCCGVSCWGHLLARATVGLLELPWESLASGVPRRGEITDTTVPFEAFHGVLSC